MGTLTLSVHIVTMICYVTTLADMQQLAVCPKGPRAPTFQLARRQSEKETVPTMLIKDLFHLLTEALTSTMVGFVLCFTNSVAYFCIYHNVS